MIPVNHEMKETKLEVYNDTFCRIEMQIYIEWQIVELISSHAYCIHDIYTFTNDFIMQLSTNKINHTLSSFLRTLLLSPESFLSNYKWKNLFQESPEVFTTSLRSSDKIISSWNGQTSP